MRERAYFFVLRDKFVTTRNKIFRVYDTMRIYSNMERCRVRFLQEAWQYTLETMCTEKKHKKKIEKLKMLPDSMRNEFLADYYKRAKIAHRLKVSIQISES
jgi:hypothetical protein